MEAELAVTLIAKERDNEAAPGAFDYVVMHDCEVIIAAARPSIKRIVASDR